MNLLKTYKHALRFRLDKDTPDDYVIKWIKVKNIAESGEPGNKNIAEQIIDNCKLEANKNLPYLQRCEGGIGGDSNNNNKQMRFRYYIGSNPLFTDDDILLNIYDSNSGIEKWNYIELNDIVCAFIKVLNNYLDEECVTGCIELVDLKSFGEEYLK